MIPRFQRWVKPNGFDNGIWVAFFLLGRQRRILVGWNDLKKSMLSRLCCHALQSSLPKAFEFGVQVFSSMVASIVNEVQQPGGFSNVL